MNLTIFFFYAGYTMLFASDRFLKNSVTLYMWYLIFKSGCLKLDVSSCSLGLVFRGTRSLEKDSLSALALRFPQDELCQSTLKNQGCSQFLVFLFQKYTKFLLLLLNLNNIL